MEAGAEGQSQVTPQDPNTRQGEPCPEMVRARGYRYFVRCSCTLQDYEPEQRAEPDTNTPHSPACWVCRDCGSVREELMTREEMEAFNE